MGIPYTPPPETPVNEVPVEVSNNFNQVQDQFQDQYQNTTIGELGQSQQTESDADSNSKSDSSSVNSANQTNVQVNNNSNRVEWDGFKFPETTLSISAYGNGNDIGGVVTVNIPIGGSPRKTIKRAANTQANLLALQFQREYTSSCASIKEQGYIVVADAQYADMLGECDNNIKRIVTRKVDTPPPPAPDNRLEQLQQQNILLQQRLDLLIQRIDNTPVPGNY